MKTKIVTDRPVDLITNYYKLAELVPGLKTLITKKKFDTLQEKHDSSFLHVKNSSLKDEEIDCDYPWLKQLLSFERTDCGVYLLSNSLIPGSHGKNGLQQTISLQNHMEQLFPEIVKSAFWVAVKEDTRNKIAKIEEFKNVREEEYRLWILFNNHLDFKSFCNFMPSTEWKVLKSKEITYFRSMQINKLFKPKSSISGLWFLAAKKSGLSSNHLVVHEITSSYSETYKGFIIPFFTDSKLILHYDSELHRLNDQNFFWVGCRFSTNLNSLMSLL